MAARTKLETAVSRQAANLDPAQREFVLAEFGTYQWNAAKIAQLEKLLEGGDLDTTEENKLFKQRHQLVAEQSSLFSHIMRWIKDTAAEESALDSFLNG